MNREELKGLLANLGVETGYTGRYKDSGDNVQFCCPFHSERRPSCGIDIYTEIGHCFACEVTFGLPKLVARCKGWYYSPEEFGRGDSLRVVEPIYDLRRAEKWLESHYSYGEVNLPSNLRVESYDGEEVDESKISSVKGRYEEDIRILDDYNSGVVTHDYFFKRGFTEDTVKKFKVGWDAEKHRVTVPVMWDSYSLCGVIGRVILKDKLKSGEYNPKYSALYYGDNSPRYLIYNKFPTGSTLFPLDHFKIKNGTIVLVEGQYDAMWLYQMGETNVLSTLTSKISEYKKLHFSKQIELLKMTGAEKIILMRDNDKAGLNGAEHDYALLKNDFSVYNVIYPKNKHDPKQLTKLEYEYMLKHARPYVLKGSKLKRFDD